MRISPRGVLVALLVVLTTTVTIHLATTQEAPPAVPATITVDGPDADTSRDDVVELTPAAQAELERGATATETPGDTHRELADALREPVDPSRTPAGVLEGPLAAQEFPGCRTRFVRNYSSRNGVQPQAIVWHQTVSRDRPGWADQDGLTALANDPRSGVSWALLIGGVDGNCTYSVPLTMKAWTQASANPFSIGIEVQAAGDEPRYVEPAGERRLLAATREIGRRFNIPMRRGRVENCRVVRSGIVEHVDLGACGGGHKDVTWDVDPLIRKLAAVTATDRTTCRKLTWWRAHGRPHGKPETNAIRRRKALKSRGVTCTARGPVKA